MLMKKTKSMLVLFLAVVLMCGVLMVWLARDTPTETELQVMAYAEEKGVAYAAYPASLIELMARNPETEEFVLNYPFHKAGAINLSGYDRTKGVPLFIQWDPQWGYLKYGGDFVAVTGCGPVCLAMAGYYVTGDTAFTPDKMVAYAQENGYYSKGNGSKWTLISQGGPALGLEVTELPLVEKKIAAYLQAGDPIIAAMGPGDFTSTGHYIVLTGYENGMLTVNDPNSYVNSEKTWPYETFADQVRNLWVIKAPAGE